MKPASALLLERWAWWRPAGVGAILAFASAPGIPLVWQVAKTATLTEGWTAAFLASLVNSAQVAILVSAAALLAGLPLGVLSAIYSFRFRTLMLVLQAMPLLLPSHLLAIGWSSMGIRFGFSDALSGHAGPVLVFSAIGIPLVVLTTVASSGSLSESQLEAARLSGGERTAFGQVLRDAFYPALVAAILSGILSLSDSGPGQIFGLATAASEILITFAAFFDFTRAAQQCLTLGVIALCIVAPILFFATVPLANQLLAKQTRPIQRKGHAVGSRLAALSMFSLVTAQLLLPLFGLILPALSGGQFQRAWNEIMRTIENTGVYAAGAGITATTLGFLLAFCAARSEPLRQAGLAGCLALLALPPALAALGVIAISGESPEWVDPLLRSRATVSLALGIRLLPVSALVALRVWASIPSTWTQAAGVHGISFAKYLEKVLLPFLLPSLLLSFLMTALLALSDIVTVLLLHPPGQTSLPLSIFTIMANAPESLVAALCLLYVASAAVLLVFLWWLAGKAWN